MFICVILILAYVALQQVTNLTTIDDGVNWRLVAQKGVDGKGAVSGVNGIELNINGNVEIKIPNFRVCGDLNSTSAASTLTARQGKELD
ncbi:hypothetical protein AEA09_17975 [Lysinibacillus contaminans]|uniref:Uncharacterized protein n=1 Tax=Lysinibacillus contaminans TaxID=1293441 RepID=A0ABR5JXD8_9BACI|nr:hypothetical protein [Lysinibacillus contaminans]KOS66625.1 hypothetical protein AEA09_17975 [Lysinibacillus contaminans]